MLRRPKRAKNEVVAPKEEESQTAENKKSVQLSPYGSQKLPHEGEKNLVKCKSIQTPRHHCHWPLSSEIRLTLR